jgi:alpha-galactosidase
MNVSAPDAQATLLLNGPPSIREDVVIDDCWHAPARSPHPPHPPVADPERFPSGIKALAGRF